MNILKKWAHPPNYMGATWEGFYVAPIARNRDSGALEESNWASQLELLSKHKADVPGEDIYSPIVVSENHWAVGWVEWVAIHESNSAAIAEAERIAERLENYPVLNEEDWSRREDEEAQSVWKDCYNDKERVEYIRKHRLQFDFRNFADLLGCARGKFFCGYASELIN